jgi:hypothetical protein
MCCFSRPVQSVSATNIFARPAAGGRQFLVYSRHCYRKELRGTMPNRDVFLPRA